MKKFLSLLLSLAMLLSVAALADETHGNYSNEMKIPYAARKTARIASNARVTMWTARTSAVWTSTT